MASEKEEAATKEALTKVNDSQSKAAATDETDSSKAELLDDEGDLSSAFTKALEEVFLRFSKSAQDHVKSKSSDSTFRGVEKHVILTDAELDDFTKAVNGGEVLDATSKEEMKEYLDVDTDGNLTYTGFCEMYHLQSGSDEDETWKDLKALGYNDQLQLIDNKVTASS